MLTWIMNPASSIEQEERQWRWGEHYPWSINNTAALPMTGHLIYNSMHPPFPSASSETHFLTPSTGEDTWLHKRNSLGYAAGEQWGPDANLGQRPAFLFCSGLYSLGPVIKIVSFEGRPDDNLFKSSIRSKVSGS